MKQIIVGFSGIPSGRCGIPVSIVRDENKRFWKMIGTKKESPINQATFETYAKEGRITRLPETEANDGDAVLYVKKPFIERFVIDREANCSEIDSNTLHYQDRLGSLRFSWAKANKLWFVVRKKDRLINQMNHWADLLCRRFDDKWKVSKKDSEKDKDELLDTAQLIVSCAYKDSLLRKGYARLALAYSYFNPERIKALHTIFIQPDLGITMQETQDMIKDVKE